VQPQRSFHVRRHCLRVAAGLTAVLALAGCAGDKSATDASAVRGSTASSFNGAGSDQFCGLLKSFSEQTKSSTSSALDPIALRRLISQSQSTAQQAVSLAPSEIKADVTMLSGVYSDVLGAMEKSGLDVTKLDPAVLSRLSSSDVQAAASHVDTYLATVCKITR